jgi:hypothetical protein
MDVLLNQGGREGACQLHRSLANINGRAGVEVETTSNPRLYIGDVLISKTLTPFR